MIPNAKRVPAVSANPSDTFMNCRQAAFDDPVSFYGGEVRKLTREYKERKQAEKMRQISDESPEKLPGYSPLKNLNNSLGSKKYIDLMQTAADFRFNVSDMVSALQIPHGSH